MKPYGVVIVLVSLMLFNTSRAQCGVGRTVRFIRWSGVAPESATPVFVYSASGEEESLAGACLARCRELQDCAAVVIAYGRGNCQGIADETTARLKVDNDVAMFKKVCMSLPENCNGRWWALENTPGYHLHSEGSHLKILGNTTIYDCYDAVFSRGDQKFRSAQWIVPQGDFDPDVMYTSDSMIGNCILNRENRFTEPESYRVSNYYTVYIENQCAHDYPKKIDRCSYEEYYNQTLRHVEFTVKNYTKDECKTLCERAEQFICRGFTWISEGYVKGGGGRGLCDLHSEDLITTGSWLLRRISSATYYRRVVCLNITVECEGEEMLVTYTPRGLFRGRVYVPGRGEQCSARARGSTVQLTLPMRGDCDVNFAYGISNGPSGVINRTMAYVMVMIQNNPIIQTAGDRWVRVGCSPDARVAKHVDTTVSVRDIGGYKKPSLSREAEAPGLASPAAASAVYGASTTPVSMYVVRALDDSGAGAVSLGEPLELRIETTDTTEIKAYHLVASSRLGDSSVLLLDGKGCPTRQVDFPSFTRTYTGGMQRLSARFKAFRFPTSHVVRFAVMVRFCDDKCIQVECNSKLQTTNRNTRQTNDTFYEWSDDMPPVQASVRAEDPSLEGVEDTASIRAEEQARRDVVARGGAACGRAAEDALELELDLLVDSKDILSTDTLVRADHRSTYPVEVNVPDGSMVCVHELLLVSLALAWLAVQIILLLGCCVLVKRYRNLAEMSVQKEYTSFDNVGFDTVSTHRRVHWPDQNIDILHAT
uniref:ZP domain-containing protein n=1 Tax=Heliothis virescens TaxID=7102 RepID=A0A2A4K3D6_HELVI